MAKITYIRDSEQDGKAQLYIDGSMLESSTFRTGVANNIHAIQWNGSSGEIEYNDGKNNESISDISSYNFETSFATKVKAISDAEALAIANRTYVDKRVLEYPPIEEQLDDIYHNGIDGWKTTIKAVKDKYPKS
tara:strand:- start:11 stop:412 length:402 start_codon:yes stop_codon:yes gene_type:complete